MLDLDACIHLDEVELAFFVEVLESTGSAVADLAAGLDTALADTRALLRREFGCRGLLHGLLFRSLDGAIPIAEMDHVLVPVGEHLLLVVSRVLEVLFQIDRGVAESRPGLRPRHADRALESGFRVNDTHAASAAPARRLYDDRIPDFSGDLERLLRTTRHRTVRPGSPGPPGL